MTNRMTIPAQKLKKFKQLMEENALLESIVYVVAGIVLAVALFKGAGLFLHTSDPIITVIGDSMIPTLYNGDLVVLQGVSLDGIKVNETIIVYPSPIQNRMIIHRVVQINCEDELEKANCTLRTLGDNNNGVLDPWNVEPAWVKGKVIQRVPYLGWPRLILRDLFGM